MTMISRNKAISNKSREIRFTVSLGLPDIKRLIKSNLEWSCQWCDEFPDFDWRADANKHPFTEVEMREGFAHKNSPTSLLPEKMREQVAAWAFAQMLAQGFVAERVGMPGTYYFTEKAFSLME